MFDLKGGLGDVVNLATKLTGTDLDLTKIITDQFVKENTKLETVKELLAKVGITSLSDVQEKIPQLNSVIKEVSSFSSWETFIAKATELYLKK